MVIPCIKPTPIKDIHTKTKPVFSIVCGGVWWWGGGGGGGAVSMSPAVKGQEGRGSIFTHNIIHNL